MTWRTLTGIAHSSFPQQQRGLVTTDPRALTHVIFATHVYGKTAESQKRAMRLLGNGEWRKRRMQSSINMFIGVLVAEGSSVDRFTMYLRHLDYFR